jgi:hypothetical protein
VARAGRVRVAVNGYGVIGKRVADAVSLQADMERVGVAEVAANAPDPTGGESVADGPAGRTDVAGDRVAGARPAERWQTTRRAKERAAWRPD